MACTLKAPHDCATVRQANDALRRHLNRACDRADRARNEALEEVARLVDYDESIPAEFAGRIRALKSQPLDDAAAEALAREARCTFCGGPQADHDADGHCFPDGPDAR